MNRWFRLYDGVLDHPKVQRLRADLFKAWVNLLCLTNRNDGVLPPIGDVAFALRVTEDDAVAIIDALVLAKLLDRDGDLITPHDWDERQFKSDCSTDRVRRHREKKGETSGGRSGNGGETFPETPSESESDQNRIKPTRAGARSQGISPEILADFKAFWAEYPLQDNEPEALTAFVKARSKVDQQTLLDGLRRYNSARPSWQHPRAAPRWLHAHGWANKGPVVAHSKTDTPDDARSRLRVADFHRDPSTWKQDLWGWPPSDPRCAESRKILIEFGYRDEEAA